MQIDQEKFLRGANAQLPEGFLLGHSSSDEGQTGCSVILCPAGAVGGVDVRGAAPATRETELLKPENMVQVVHAVMLSGGSAFGLDASGGVMCWLEEHGFGLTFAGTIVPIVVGAALFDLLEGDSKIRPNAAMGYDACSNASSTITVGRIGAGRGATVGKLLGPASAMAGGLGACSFSSKNLTVTAIVAVNAVGNVYDATNNTALAGVLDRSSNQQRIIDPLQAFALAASSMTPDNQKSNDKVNADNATADNFAHGTRADSISTNTTLGCILTNARLDKAQANRAATMAHDGYARAIHPVHTSNDGDAIFCLSAGSQDAHPDLVGTLAALAMERAIHNAVS